MSTFNVRATIDVIVSADSEAQAIAAVERELSDRPASACDYGGALMQFAAPSVAPAADLFAGTPWAETAGDKVDNRRPDLKE